jgi:four helix bundle protein
MSYKDLEIYQLARELSFEIHKMTLEELPKFEMFEEGRQIRKSSKSTRHNIVEGYGRKRYNNEFIHFIVFSIVSNDETRDHLETLYETESLENKEIFEKLLVKTDKLGIKLHNFLDFLGSK